MKSSIGLKHCSATKFPGKIARKSIKLVKNQLLNWIFP